MCDSKKVHHVNVDLSDGEEKVSLLTSFHPPKVFYKILVQVLIASIDLPCFPCYLQLTMKGLLSWAKTNLIKERPEMFMKGDTV